MGQPPHLGHGLPWAESNLLADDCAELWGYSTDYWLRTVACQPGFPPRIGAGWRAGDVIAYRNSHPKTGRRGRRRSGLATATADPKAVKIAPKKHPTEAPERRPVDNQWLTEPEAAEYARCSLWAFRKMGLPASNSGGRKVYYRQNLDDALLARPWTPNSVQTANLDPRLLDRLANVRLRPYKPRKPKPPS